MKMDSNTNKKHHFHATSLPNHSMKSPTGSSSTIGVGYVSHLCSFVSTTSSLWGARKNQSKSFMVPLKHVRRPPSLSKSSQSRDSQSSSNDETSSLTSSSSSDDEEEVEEEDALRIDRNHVNVEDYNARKSCNSIRNSYENNNNGGSIRGKLAVELLPSYLTDARSVERYHPKNCTD
eukprot:CAMPEP_0194390322 /NCGR_PEP_ID=MMETSP0174-20130528/109262_1 /TAXON_ID=216777 /ORGANISM="Proboscia alata, Strain PI-D3" /LENGTH=176 /DNA_ID=CAMNT_0039183519 /DNA_START=89 /DNA_END=616 /DNA_ORIENTATION=+